MSAGALSGMLPGVSIVSLILGILLVVVGGINLVGPERVVARYQRRAPGVSVWSPARQTAIGTLLIFAGLIQLALAFR